MRILVVTSQFPCLSETFVVDHIVGLIQHKHEVRILSMSRSPQDLHQSAIAKHDLTGLVTYVTPLKANRLLDVLTSIRSVSQMRGLSWRRKLKLMSNLLPFRTGQRKRVQILKVLTDWQPDLVHCHYGFNGRELVALRDDLNHKYPIVTSFHGCDMTTPTKGTYYDTLFRLGDHFIANTSFTRDALVHSGCEDDKISTIPVGVNLSEMPSFKTASASIDQLKLVSVARLVEFKGIDVAIKAIRRLVDRGIACSYRVVGDGALLHDLEQQVRDLDLMEKVTFVGSLTRDEVYGEIFHADVFVLPSIFHNGRTETQGLVIQESQAIGTPVIASRVGGITDAVVHERTGLLFEPGDPDGLVDRIIRLQRSPALISSIRNNARSLVTSNYSNNTISAALCRLYEALLTSDTPNQKTAHS